MNILLLAGSPSGTSRSTRLLHHIGDKLASLGHRYVKLQVSDLPAQALLHAEIDDVELKLAQDHVRQADAVVISTPVYQAAYSGILKAFLDVLPQDGLAGKLVLPLATGGSQSHMLALDYALRPVLTALDARHVLPGIFATDAQVHWTPEQGMLLDAGIARRVMQGVAQLSAGLRAGQEAAASVDAMPCDPVRCRA